MSGDWQLNVINFSKYQLGDMAISMLKKILFLSSMQNISDAIYHRCPFFNILDAMWHAIGIKLSNTIILPTEFIQNRCLWKICAVLGSWCILWFLHQNVVLVTLFCIPYFTYGRSTELSECMSKCSWCGIQIFRLMVGLKMLFLHLCLRQETL